MMWIMNNRAYKILSYLCGVGLATRRNIVAKLNQPRTTIYDTLHKMRKLGLIDKIPIGNMMRGRPRVFWTITKKGREVVKSE